MWSRLSGLVIVLAAGIFIGIAIEDKNSPLNTVLLPEPEKAVVIPAGTCLQGRKSFPSDESDVVRIEGKKDVLEYKVVNYKHPEQNSGLIAWYAENPEYYHRVKCPK